MSRAGALATVLLGTVTAAHADPLRLRADALASTQSPAGLLVLEADALPASGLSAEAVVWMAGARELDDRQMADVLVIALRGKTADGRASGQVGRFVASLGALRPTHLDGGAVRVRLPKRIDLEATTGVPVLPGLGSGRAWDWYAATRASRRIGEWGAVGVAYGHRREAGTKTGEEVGVDAGFVLTKRADVGARAAYNLATSGLAEVTLTSSYRRKSLRGDVYAIHRDASHLLPATSLFSVIGDVPSQRAGMVLTWKAAPRLDLIADLGARYTGEMGAELVGRARLRLDDRGASVLGGELRRSGVGDDMWTGLRGTARVALPHSLVASTELELVIPDQDRGRGSVWPWALGALGYERGDWQAAVAVEASASPEYTSRFDVLGQLTRRWRAK